MKNFRDWYSVMSTQLKKGREEKVLKRVLKKVLKKVLSKVVRKNASRMQKK